jgi:hypothetical protein
MDNQALTLVSQEEIISIVAIELHHLALSLLVKIPSVDLLDNLEVGQMEEIFYLIVAIL